MSKIHIFEISPTDKPGPFLRTSPGLAEDDARKYLDAHPDVDTVGIYHSYPSPGPQRRFVKTVRR